VPADNAAQQTASGWQLVEDSYRKIAQQANARNIPVILVIYPTLDTLETPDGDDLTRRLEALALELGWAAIDVAPAFAPDGKSLFLPDDPVHPNAAGYARAAARAAESIVEQRLLR
jgi:lysophospholipase L1-like esterase